MFQRDGHNVECVCIYYSSVMLGFKLPVRHTQVDSHTARPEAILSITIHFLLSWVPVFASPCWLKVS